MIHRNSDLYFMKFVIEQINAIKDKNHLTTFD